MKIIKDMMSLKKVNTFEQDGPWEQGHYFFEFKKYLVYMLIIKFPLRNIKAKALIHRKVRWIHLKSYLDIALSRPNHKTFLDPVLAKP